MVTVYYTSYSTMVGGGIWLLVTTGYSTVWLVEGYGCWLQLVTLQYGWWRDMATGYYWLLYTVWLVEGYGYWLLLVTLRLLVGWLEGYGLAAPLPPLHNRDRSLPHQKPGVFSETWSYKCLSMFARKLLTTQSVV